MNNTAMNNHMTCTRTSRFRSSAASMLSAMALIGVLLLPNIGLSETAAEAAKKPAQAPKPARLADGHPNWTGFWVPAVGLLQMNIGLGGSPELPPGTKRPPFPQPFGNVAPYKPAFKDRVAKIKEDVASGKVIDKVVLCYPPGMPRMMSAVYGIELLQTPGQIAITSEWQYAGRRIWMDMKEHSPSDELDPTYAGESIGHWEGDTLVVDTIGVREDVPVNFVGMPQSGKMHIVERLTSKTPGFLTNEITIDDPDAFERPWKEVQTYRYRPDLRIREYVCLDNNRNVGAGGEAVFD